MAPRASRTKGDEAGPAGAFDCADRRYGSWRTDEVRAGDRELRMVSKPGVPAFGELDPSAALLLDHLDVRRTDTVRDLHCGSGVVGALAALSAPEGRVWMADRNLLSVEASRRTLAANGVTNAEVFFGDAPPAPADVALVRLPKGKIPTLQLLRAAWHDLRPDGRCYLAGGNDEGIRTAIRQMEALFGNAAVLGYRGGHRVAIATRSSAEPVDARDFDLPWHDRDAFHRFAVETRGGRYEVLSRPGVFSWDRMDRGSEALIETMELEPEADVLELGCGYGIVGCVAARVSGSARVVMVDVDAESIRAATRTAEANGLASRCEVLASDVAAAVLDRRFDLVVTNPPFHVGKATDLDVPAQFIRDAARVLRPGGRVFLVANRTLPYERWMAECFGSYRVALDGREFKVLTATRPA